jgi:hypothetical protein
METAIVVAHTRGVLPDGHIINGHAAITRARLDGALVLPYDEGVPENCPAGDYFRRGWGGGWVATGNRGQRLCPMLIFATPERSNLYWLAIVGPTTPDARPRGVLRLTTGLAQYSTAQGGLSAVDSPPGHVETFAADSPSGIYVARGKSRVSVSGPGFLPLDLYAVAEGCSVLVSAVTVTREPVAFP